MKIEYVDISREEFQNKLKGFQDVLSNLNRESGILDKESIKTPKDLMMQIMSKALITSGIDVDDTIASLMEQAKSIGVFDANNRKNYTRAKQQIDAFLTVGQTNDMIKELDEKFKNQIQFYR